MEQASRKRDQNGYAEEANRARDYPAYGRVRNAKHRHSRPQPRSVDQDDDDEGDHQGHERQRTGSVIRVVPAREQKDAQAHSKNAEALQKGDAESLPREQADITLSRRPSHDVGLGLLGLEDERARGVDDQLKERDVDRQDEERPIGKKDRHHRKPAIGT